MRKYFCTLGSKVGGTKFIIPLFAILKYRDESQSFPAQITHQVLKRIVHNWQDCHNSIRAYGLDIPRFYFLPNLPQYKYKIRERNLLSHDNHSLAKKGIDPNKRLLHLSQLDIIISTKSQDIIKVRVVPATALYFFEVPSQQPVTLVDLNDYLRTGIDLGMENLVALASNKPTFTPTIYHKKHLKSINQGFKQHRLFLLSKIDQVKSTTRHIHKITFNRNKRLEYYIHKTSILIVKRLGDEKIVQSIIGTNVRHKQNIRFKKKHPTLGGISHNQLIKIITYKTKLVGIKVIVTEASYTNKCRFGDLEPVGKQEPYQGKRDQGGWLRSWNESRINADVNAGLNIIRKVNVNSPP